MSRITGVIVALATTAAVLTGSTSGAAPPTGAGVRAGAPRAADLPREIEGGVELDAGRRRPPAGVRRRENYRTVWSGVVTPRPGPGVPARSCCKRKNLFCGDVDARTANGAVAAHREVRPLQLLRGPGPGRLARALVARHGDLVVVRARGRGLRRAGHLRRRQQRDLARARRLRHPHRGGIHAPPPGHARARSTPAPPRSPTTRRSPTCTAPRRPSVRARRPDPHR